MALRSAKPRLFIRLALLIHIVVSLAACGKAQVVERKPREATVFLDTVMTEESVALQIFHRDWRGNTWEYRAPEYMIISGETSERLVPEVTRNLDEGSVTFNGTKGGAISAEYSMTFHPGIDVIDMEATVTNTGPILWTQHSFGLTCMVFRMAPAFFDFTARQTFAHFDGAFRSVLDTREHAGINLMLSKDIRHSAHVLREADVGWTFGHNRVDWADASLIVRSSPDSLFHVAQAWEDAFSVSYNLRSDDLNCIHSNPRFAMLGPGESHTIRGRIYFFRGTIDALYERFRRDFPTRGYGERLDE